MGICEHQYQAVLCRGLQDTGFEIIEQLGWKAPDNVVVPCASGSLLTKVWKSFKEFKIIGIIKELETKMFAAQATGCAPISVALKQGNDVIRPVKPNTIANPCIGNPADGFYAIQPLRRRADTLRMFRTRKSSRA